MKWFKSLFKKKEARSEETNNISFIEVGMTADMLDTHLNEITRIRKMTEQIAMDQQAESAFIYKLDLNARKLEDRFNKLEKWITDELVLVYNKINEVKNG